MERPRARIPLVVCLLALAGSAFAAVPGEVPHLEWCAGTKDCLTWTAAPSATSYTVYRGNGASLARLATGETDGCSVRRFATTTSGALLDESPLPSDGLEWYLVVGRNADGEGTAGSGSAGARQLDAWGSCCNQKVFGDTFSLPDGSPWSSDWSELAASAESFTVSSGRGRWRPWYSRYSLARLGAPLGISGDAGAPGERDVEVTFTIEFDDVANQGIGFYVRQNGGYCLREPDWTVEKVAPCSASFNGSGYGVFIHGSFLNPPGSGLDLWAERDGDEQRLCPGGVCGAAFAMQNGIRYRVRFRALQTSATTTTLHVGSPGTELEFAL